MARVFDCRNYIPNYCYQKVAGSIPAVEIFALLGKARQKTNKQVVMSELTINGILRGIVYLLRKQGTPESVIKRIIENYNGEQQFDLYRSGRVDPPTSQGNDTGIDPPQHGNGNGNVNSNPQAPHGGGRRKTRHSRKGKGKRRTYRH
jgi:hypothetical protein